VGTIPKLAPGDSVNVIDDSDAPDLISPDVRWRANLHRYQLYANLMLGGDRVLCPPSSTLHPLTGEGLPDRSYLRRLPAETSRRNRDQQDAWEVRRNAASHDPVAARIIWTYVDTLTRQDVDRSAVRTELGDTIMEDVDRRGTAAEDWLPWAYAQGLAQGWMVGLVDMPARDPNAQPPASRAHEEAEDIRPYLQLVLPSRVVQLDVDDYGTIMHAVIRESLDSWRIWEPTTSQLVVRKLIEANGRKAYEYDIGEERPHGFDGVPMALFIANDPDPDDPESPWGESAMKATSLVDLQILQHMSLADDVQRKTGFPFLHIQREPLGGGAEAPDSDYTLGPDFVLATEAVAQWLAPPSDCTREQRDHIASLESIAYKIGGVHRRSQDSVEAHSGLALDWENAPIYATVHRWARRLRTWETKLWRLMARAAGKSGDAIRVVYPDDFSSRPAAQDLAYAKSITDVYGGYEAMPGFARVGVDALVVGVLQRLKGHLAPVRDALDAALKPSEPEQTDDAATQTGVDLKEAVPQDTALNGAQVTAAQGLLTAAANSEIPRESVAALLAFAYPMDSATAERILGPIGTPEWEAQLEAKRIAATPPQFQSFTGAQPPPQQDDSEDEEEDADDA